MNGPGPAPFPLGAILGLLKTLANVQVYESRAPRPELGAGGGPMAFLIVTVGRVRRKGQDDYRVEYDPTSNALTAELGGQRYVGLMLRASSLDPTLLPEDIIERVRWGFGVETTEWALSAAGVALTRLGDTICYESPPPKGNNHIVMNAAMEIGLAYCPVASPITQAVNPDDGNFVATVDDGAPPPIAVEP